MSRLARGATLGAGAGIVMCLAGALVAQLLLSTEVLVIAPKPPEVVRMERGLWEPGEPVAPIYGVPAAQTTRVLLVDRSRLIRPTEDPSLLLLAVDRQRGDHPLQVKTLWFFAVRIALALGLLMLLSLALLLWQRSRGGASNSPRVQLT